MGNPHMSSNIILSNEMFSAKLKRINNKKVKQTHIAFQSHNIMERKNKKIESEKIKKLI